MDETLQRIEETSQVLSYRQAQEYIESLAGLGSVPGLDSITQLCRRVGDPQDELSFVHIAGTNGKGSTSAYLSYILMEAGYKVGRYNSPTIQDYRERICVNKQMITKDALARLVTVVKNACDDMVREGLAHPTVFEVETVLGFLYFKEKKCDICMLEVGMGGLLDATNLVKTTKLAVLASISMDHMAFLGDSLAKIAEQKCGIIKEGCTVVSCEQREEVSQVILETCQKQKAELIIADTKRLSQMQFGLKGQSFVVDDSLRIEIALLGKYQFENALLAVTAAQALRTLGFSISDAQLVRGMKKTVWHGRFEVIADKPLFVVDGAHNEDAARKLADSVRFYFTNKKIIYIMGILKDKEYEKIVQQMAPMADSIITIKTPDNPRAMDAYSLAQVAMRYHERVTSADSLEEAVEMARLLADKDSVILAFGSLSFLGLLMKIVQK